MTDTIAALATARGPAAIAVLRVSGPATQAIASEITGRTLSPRQATLCHFRDASGEPLDQGLALFFPAPASFTGEDMLELHTHGGELVTGLVLERVCALGARHARPGEFSERAFLNDKLDLLQAEAIGELIASTSRQAARSALRSLHGEFSQAVEGIRALLMQARAHCEARLDFAEEGDVAEAEDPLSEPLQECSRRLDALLARAEEGRRWQGTAQLVIAGPSNVGKSTLFNALCREERAIVSNMPGTTRDVVSCAVRLGGVAVDIADTAGLRTTPDAIEREGMRRTQQLIDQADLVLYLTEVGAPQTPAPETEAPLLLVQNKADLSASTPEGLAISARTGQGLAQLTEAILQALGRHGTGEDMLLARQRHLQALQHCQTELRQAQKQQEPELIAEHLRLAQQALDNITGATVPDDILGEIFSRFCIGK